MSIRRKAVLIVVALVVLWSLSYGWEAWAMPLQNRMRQTVPTRTPRPATATPAPPAATFTPQPPPPQPPPAPAATAVAGPTAAPALPVTGE
jgi:hypothetical protein